MDLSLTREPFIIEKIAPGTIGDREPLISVESRHCAEAIDNLTSIITKLEDRLDRVRNHATATESDPGDPVPKASPLAVDLREYAFSINRLSRRLSAVLEELEV